MLVREAPLQTMIKASFQRSICVVARPTGNDGAFDHGAIETRLRGAPEAVSKAIAKGSATNQTVMHGILWHGDLAPNFHAIPGWLLRRKLTLRSNSPFSRLTETSANWDPVRSAFTGPVAVTLPSWARHKVIPAEHALHNQKYSGALTSDGLRVRSASSRNSLPSCK